MVSQLTEGNNQLESGELRKFQEQVAYRKLANGEEAKPTITNSNMPTNLDPRTKSGSGTSDDLKFDHLKKSQVVVGESGVGGTGGSTHWFLEGKVSLVNTAHKAQIARMKSK